MVTDTPCTLYCTDHTPCTCTTSSTTVLYYTDPVLHRPYAYREGDTLYLYYEQYKALELFRESSILVRRANISHTDTGVLYCTVLYFTVLYCTSRS